MSPHVNTVAASFIEMVKALEERPAMETRIAELEGTNARLTANIDRHHERIMALQDELATASSTIKTLEAARDDAEFRFLVADDKLASFRRLVEAFGAETKALVEVIDAPETTAPKAESHNPEPAGATAAPAKLSTALEAAPLPNREYTQADVTNYLGHQQGSPTMPPASFSSTSGGFITTETPTPIDESGQSSGFAPVGQREPDPTLTPASTEPTPQPIEDTAASTADATSDGSTVTSNPPLGPYHGKRYANVPGYISLIDWLDGGGTREDYYGTL